MTPTTISELEQAINNARQSQPTDGQQAALSADVALLAQIYGQLIYRRHKAFDADSLTDPERAALQYWLSAENGQGRAA